VARLVADPDREGDVLVAPATPPGASALAVVRLTGPAGATRRVARQIARRLPEEPRPREAVLHLLVGEDGRPLDRALVLFFPAPHSATGEEVVEFLCHGSPAIVAGLLAAARAAGARPAARGEFTRRALANGKLDLAEAEGIAALAAAESRGAARRALSLVEGELSRRVHAAKESVLDVLAGLEAGLDFAEDVPAADLVAAGEALAAAAHEAEALAAAAARGGVRDRRKAVAILGRPNAGKSTLFNALVGRDRAIVTAVPGTTRDAIAETCEIGGETVTLLDTAGLRATEDEVEKIGVEVAERAGASADLLLYAIDANTAAGDEDEEFLRKGRGASTLVIGTKADLADAAGRERVLGAVGGASLLVSARTGAGLEALRAHMAARLSLVESDGELLVLERHREALVSAAASLRAAAERARSVPGEPELVAAHAREALAALGAITGETATEELLDRIFAAFCVGK
jgi:tRNA modification GTPase